MEILFEHIKKYPKMRIADAVKLLYQRQFGGGHLISDEKACVEYLRKEYFSVPEKNTMLIEDIGAGMCRVHLAAAKFRKTDYLKIAKAFIASANSVKGDVSKFEEDLKKLICECKKGSLPFIYEDAVSYIKNYKKLNYPPVSHSEIYRENYMPAYRVMQRSYADGLISEEV